VFYFCGGRKIKNGLLLRSSASSSQLGSFWSRLQTALKRRTGRPTGRRPVASLPYTTSFGIRPSFIRQICPGLNVYDMHVPYDKHHEVSSEWTGKKKLVKSHQNTHNSVCQIWIRSCLKMSNNPTKYQVLIKQYLRSVPDISHSVQRRGGPHQKR